MSVRFSIERIRLRDAATAVGVRAKFPGCWNLLTDEQHRLQRRGYVLRDAHDHRLAAAVVVQFHDSPGGCQVWVNKLSVAAHLQPLLDTVESVLLRQLQTEISHWQVPLLVLALPERTDFLRTLGFVAWRIHRSLVVPMTVRPPASGPVSPATPNETTTETTAPPRLSDCWAMLWMPPEPELQDN